LNVNAQSFVIPIYKQGFVSWEKKTRTGNKAKLAQQYDTAFQLNSKNNSNLAGKNRGQRINAVRRFGKHAREQLKPKLVKEVSADKERN